MNPEITYHSNGVIRSKSWKENGKLHRVDAPAVFGFDLNGEVCLIGWYIDDKLHREGGPAKYSYAADPNYEEGSSPAQMYMGGLRVCWYYEGKLHNPEGPALLSYYQNDQLKLEEWYIHGRSHREDGPAEIRYRDNGMVVTKSWSVNGLHHRVDGPARIRYTKDGAINHEEWLLFGVEVDKDDHAEFIQMDEPTMLLHLAPIEYSYWAMFEHGDKPVLEKLEKEYPQLYRNVLASLEIE